MELNIQEKDITNNNTKNKRKQISYDDLLSNMGFKLNNGKLELYNKKIDENTYTNQNQYTYQNNQNINNQNIKNQNNQNIKNQNNQNIKNQNIQEKNITQAQPMTKKQYRRLLQLQYLEKMKEKERINNIKSKKLLFSNPLTINNINQSIPVLNKFFQFSR